jgi:hypothetical protein
MTKAVLFSAENIQKAKIEIFPLARAFLQVEPRNTMALPETKQGMNILEQAFNKLESIGYSPEDAQLLVSEVVEKINSGDVSSFPASAFEPLPPVTNPKKNEF